ncbi:MAG: NAD-dependent epimerase/dehydratase family protein [Stomatobaculum sp.]
MRILITGATSFVGAAVCRELLRRGNEVYALVRPNSGNTARLPQHRRFYRVCGDMEDMEVLRRAAELLPPPEVCLHFAWAGIGVQGRMSPEIQEKNVRNTLSLLRFLGGLHCRRFLFAGSQAEYGTTLERVRTGECDGMPVTEKALCRPISEYGKGKCRVLREGAPAAEALGMEYRHLRIFSVYGEGDHEGSLVSSCVNAAAAGKEIRLGPCAQQWNFLHVRDCARAISDVAMLESSVLHAGSEAYNIGSVDTRPLKDFVREIFAAAERLRREEALCGEVPGAEMLCGGELTESNEHSAGAGHYLFEEKAAGPEGTPYLSPDISKLCSATGWREELSFSEGISELLRVRIKSGRQRTALSR